MRIAVVDDNKATWYFSAGSGRRVDCVDGGFAIINGAIRIASGAVGVYELCEGRTSLSDGRV